MVAQVGCLAATFLWGSRMFIEFQGKQPKIAPSAFVAPTAVLIGDVEIGGRELAKVGFDDRKIVYYFLEDLDRDEDADKRTFHDLPDEPAG